MDKVEGRCSMELFQRLHLADSTSSLSLNYWFHFEGGLLCYVGYCKLKFPLCSPLPLYFLLTHQVTKEEVQILHLDI